MKQKKFYAFFGFEKLKKIAFHSLGISISLVFSLLLNSKGQNKKNPNQSNPSKISGTPQTP